MFFRRIFSRSKSPTGVGNHGSPASDGEIGFSGNYSTWKDATAASTGYDKDIILQKTRDAALKVKRGEAAQERDSVVFDRIEHAFPVLAALLRAGIENGGRVSVLDFGGSLGSSYFQCREFLQGLQVRWSIIEQPKHVACGRADFQDEALRFYLTVDECLQHEQPNVVLISCVLQYLEEPYKMLENLLSRGIQYVILDRMALVKGDKDHLTVESVPASIYPATYPAWFLSEDKLLSKLKVSYRMIADFIGFDSAFYKLDGAEICFKGFILEWIQPGETAPAQAREKRIKLTRKPVLLNVGCGMRIHPDWVNIDITSTLPGVIAHDISRSLPLETNSCDAIFNSAVLEHIRPADVARFMSECHRVLKPGGIIRIGVPDLEQIAGLYLQKLRDAGDGVAGADADYDWMMLEMFDQTTRERSGGEMLRFLARNPMPNEHFVMERIGMEGEEIVEQIRGNPAGVEAALNLPAPDALRIGKFRLSGEVHQWMYDRFSLGRLLQRSGFKDPKVVQAGRSSIPDWGRYSLDATSDGKVIKPDLFFMEATRG